MNHCKYIFLIILLICLFLLFKKSNKFTGGNTNDKRTNKSATELDNMIKNGSLTDNQKLEILKKNKVTQENLVKKNNNIYTNLLTNLSSTDDEIDIAELNLEDSKNQLLLAEINLNLKKSILNKKNKKNDELLDFYVKLNTAKQYNIYTIILMSNVRKIRKNTIVSPNDQLFKTQLLESVNETADFATLSYNKTNDLYKFVISSNVRDISNYKSDLSNSRILARELKDNIIKIQSRINNKNNLDKEIKQKLSAKKEPQIDEITDDESNSLFDNLASLFQSF
tara:strand:- start:1547 stop:2389 length:843 start_codon:yes stop_codon:yes gene_type:complete